MCRFREESLLELCAVSEKNLYQNYAPPSAERQENPGP